MNEERDTPSRTHRLLLVAALMIVVLTLDLVSKAWAWNTLRSETIQIIPDVFHLEFGFNTGSAFSLLRDESWARGFFIVVTVFALGYMARLALTLPTRWPSGFFAIALIAGGALGNLHDRLFRVLEELGEARYGVVDFVRVKYWPGKWWPTFNVADAALVAGVLLLLLYLHRHGEPTKQTPATS